MSDGQSRRGEGVREGVVAERDSACVATVTGIDDACTEVVFEKRVIEEDAVTVEYVQSSFGEKPET